MRFLQPKTTESGVDAVVARVGAMPFLAIVALLMLLPGLATLPPMDRDEPRFAQASKQMLETSDFVAIRFGDEARNKKPVGIHWLQAATVRLAELAGVPDARRRIWLYRVPSLLGAVAAVLLTYWAALPLVTRRGAILAAMLMAATPLLGAEARLATTDAVLCATVTAAMGALARVYLADPETRRRKIGPAAIFWLAMGIGILIKGPITPMIAAFGSIVLSVRDRSARWLRALRPLRGAALCLLIVLPWFILILVKTHGTFFTEAVGRDLIGKVEGGQEMHGAPPGFYALAFWLTGWPLAPFLALAAPALWRSRRDPAAIVLLAWVVPAWLLFEAVPTKLVHYALPLYPALAILAVFGLEGSVPLSRVFRAPAGWILFGLLSLVPAAVLALVVAGEGWLWTLGPVGLALAALAMLASATAAWAARRALIGRNFYGAGTLAVLAAWPVYLFVFGWLLTPGVAASLAVSPRLASAADAALGPACPHPRYATVGDREPSLMFATDAGLLMTDPVGAAQFMAEGDCRVAFVEAPQEAAFRAALGPALPVRQAARVGGIAINGGHTLDIGVYIRQ